MRVLFVQPVGTGLFHLGIGYLAGALKAGGFNDVEHISILDPERFHVPSKRRTKEYFLERVGHADLVAVSSTTHEWIDALDICRISKENGCDVIVGGPQPSLNPEKVLRDNHFIDAVIYGEAENTVCDIVSRFESGRDLGGIRGTAYRCDGEITRNEPNNTIKDLDALPFPDRGSIDLKDFTSPFPILTSRGCPYQCVFCSKPVHGTAFRPRSPENIVSEIEEILKKYPDVAKQCENKITVVDDVFNLNVNRAKEICNLIIKRDLGLKITLINGLHVRTIDMELCEKLKTAGCNEIWYGAESGDERVLSKAGKFITTNMVRQAVLYAKQAGIDTVGGHFIIGLPGETLETARNSIRFAEEAGFDVVAFSHATPYQQTALMKWVEENAKAFYSEEDYSQFLTENKNPRFETDSFGEEERRIAFEEADALAERLYRKRILRPGSILKHVASLRSKEDFAWAFDKVCELVLKRNTNISNRVPSIAKRSSGQKSETFIDGI